MFCLTEAGKQQIDWVPEKDKAAVERHAICKIPKPKLTVEMPKIWQISLPK